MFSQEDVKQIELRGSSVATVEAQVERFKVGFPWMRIVGAANPQRGIVVMDDAQAEEAIAYCDNATIAGKCKFVPASGAASRMFKDIFSGLATLEGGEDVAEGSPVQGIIQEGDHPDCPGERHTTTHHCKNVWTSSVH